jgi:hypothetical protein
LIRTFPETWWLPDQLPDRSQAHGYLRRGKYSWLYVLWILIGIVVAVERHYITVYLLKLVLSAILAILLWPLVLLGISLHIH